MAVVSDGESMVHSYFSLRLWIDQSRQDHDRDACVLIAHCSQIQEGKNLKEVIIKDYFGSQLKKAHFTSVVA